MNFTKEDILNKKTSEIYSFVLDAITPFLKENDYFNTTLDEIKIAIYTLIDNSKKDTNFNSFGPSYLEYIKKNITSAIRLEVSDVYVPDSIKTYLKEIATYPLLTKAEEYELYEKIYNGDKEARERIINCNLRLVVSIAKRYAKLGFPLLDMIQNGNLGLLKATDKFNSSKGYKFSTYATWWIKQTIIREIVNTENNIKIPEGLNDKMHKIEKAINIYLSQYGEEPTNQQIAEIINKTYEIKMTELEVEAVRAFMYDYVSMNEHVTDEEETEFGQMLPSSENIEDEVLLKDLSEELTDFLKSSGLSDKQISIVSYKFGLIDGKEYNDGQIAKILKVSAKNVTLTLKSALNLLKLSPYKHRIANYYDGKYDTVPFHDRYSKRKMIP